MSSLTKNEDYLTSIDVGLNVDLSSSENVVYVTTSAESDTAEMRINAAVRRHRLPPSNLS